MRVNGGSVDDSSEVHVCGTPPFLMLRTADRNTCTHLLRSRLSQPSVPLDRALPTSMLSLSSGCVLGKGADHGAEEPFQAQSQDRAHLGSLPSSRPFPCLVFKVADDDAGPKAVCGAEGQLASVWHPSILARHDSSATPPALESSDWLDSSEQHPVSFAKRLLDIWFGSDLWRALGHTGEGL